MKTAPEAPEGLEYKPKKKNTGNDMAKVFMKSIIDVASELKEEKDSNDWYGDD